MVYWQINSESCLSLWFAFHLDEAAMIFNDPINHGQSEASTCAALFRCEERLKNVRPNLLADSAASVPNTNADIILGVGIGPDTIQQTPTLGALRACAMRAALAC